MPCLHTFISIMNFCMWIKYQCFGFQKPLRQTFYYIMKLIFIALLFCEAETQSNMKKKNNKNQPKWPFQQLCSQNFFVNLRGDMLFRSMSKTEGVMTHRMNWVYWKTLRGMGVLTVMGPPGPSCWLAQKHDGVSASYAGGRCAHLHLLLRGQSASPPDTTLTFRTRRLGALLQHLLQLSALTAEA